MWKCRIHSTIGAMNKDSGQHECVYGKGKRREQGGKGVVATDAIFGKGKGGRMRR
jgi:hypothetical protein